MEGRQELGALGKLMKRESVRSGIKKGIKKVIRITSILPTLFQHQTPGRYQLTPVSELSKRSVGG